MKVKLNEKIKNLRKQAKLSQEELAEQLHVSRQTVFKWESGKSVPDTDNVVLMSKLFHVPLEELLYDEVEIGQEGIATDLDEMVKEAPPDGGIYAAQSQEQEEEKPQEHTKSPAVAMKRNEALRLCAVGEIVLCVAFLGAILFGLLFITDGGYMYLASMIAGFFTLVTVVYVAPFVALLYLSNQALKGGTHIGENVVSMLMRFVVFVTVIVGLIHMPVAMSVAIAGSVYGYVAMLFGLLTVSLGVFTCINLKMEVKA